MQPALDLLVQVSKAMYRVQNFSRMYVRRHHLSLGMANNTVGWHLDPPLALAVERLMFFGWAWHNGSAGVVPAEAEINVTQTFAPRCDTS